MLARPDDETFVVHRGARVAVVLNAYPYGSGHLLVLPTRAVADLPDLTADEAAELWATVTDAVAAIRAAYAPDGVNVGLNLGSAAGAGVPDHLHVHVLPRWAADANFMTVGGRDPGPPRAARRHLRQAPRRLAHLTVGPPSTRRIAAWVLGRGTRWSSLRSSPSACPVTSPPTPGSTPTSSGRRPPGWWSSPRCR